MKKKTKRVSLTLIILALTVLMVSVSVTGPLSASASGFTDDKLVVASADNPAPIASTFQGYLYLVLTGKTGNTWQVRVYGQNPKQGYFMQFEYSSYMCYINDAKSWSNINSSHIKTNTDGIPGFNGVNIEITENWFADGIAVSYLCTDGNRYVTSANLLSKWDWTMTQYNTSVPR